MKNLDTDHPFFTVNGISKETAEHFGLGYCKKGIMKDRVAIPIHDHHGQLVAYAGLSVTEEQAEEEGRYKLPKDFRLSEVVFNLHRQDDNQDWLIVAEEDCLTTILVHQNGFSNTIALMGPELQKGQEEAILKHLGTAGRLTLLSSESIESVNSVDHWSHRLSSKLFIKKALVSSFVALPTPQPSEQIADAV